VSGPGDVLPLREGDRGDAVVDVQHRLSDLGFYTVGDPDGDYGPATRAAVEAFQHRRGLRVDGACGQQTWATLVEAGFAVGDRLLWRRAPMVRGDDVAEVQRLLGALGFDTGRVDGIFGDQTAVALRDFQRNAGLPVDGIVGPDTLTALLRFQGRERPGDTELVSTVRAREQLRQAPRTLRGRHVALGQTGDMPTVVRALSSRLASVGAQVAELHHPDPSSHARTANATEAVLYLGMRLEPAAQGCRTAYYAGYRDESPGGHRLADLVQARLPAAVGVPDLGSVGMSVPVLRETRMTAVVVELGPADVVVEHGPDVAGALADALIEWARTVGD
jgi:N-acetylmuramoyl-L-alanine amidase